MVVTPSPTPSVSLEGAISQDADWEPKNRKGFKMKTLFLTLAALTALSTFSVSASAKVFDDQHLPKNINQLRNGDSFSVECRNMSTGVIDRETVDVDAATVTVEIPGNEPIVHHITEFSVYPRQIQDRFGQPGIEVLVMAAAWGHSQLFLSSDRWMSNHEDGSVWMCAN